MFEWINATWNMHGHFITGYLVCGLISWFSEMKSSGIFKALGLAYNDPGTSKFMLLWMSIPLTLGSCLFCTVMWLPASLVRDLHLILEGGWGPVFGDDDDD